jgi:glucosamine--fructose-6-phosphate aminotransferase (isomerizing)
MGLETAEVPAVVTRLLSAEQAAFDALGAELRARPPASMLTVARGSSDHAAHYMAYLVMARLGRLVTSLPMSLVTLHESQIQAEGLLAVAFSQSGESPDLVATLQHMGLRGARTVAFVNAPASPLAAAADRAIGLHAGPERSVAATKSFVCQLVCGAALVGAWQADAAWSEALRALPEALASAALLDWTPAAQALVGADRLFVIGRGTGMAMALEAALKFKEVCGIHAEAYSGAELRHGPMALVEDGFPVLVLAPRGPAQAGLVQLAFDLQARGAQVLLAAPTGNTGLSGNRCTLLPLATAGHPDLDPVAIAPAFYRMVESLARMRGRDPDHPPHLHKVTLTH